MKRRCLGGLLALLMLLPLVPPAAAADAVYFTAVDDRVLDLNDATMPFWFGGYLYVAATVFRESGVGYSYNIVSQRLVLYESSRSLVFDVATGSATNGQGEPFDHVCVTRNGVTFVAASPVAAYFGRIYSNTRVSQGSLVRVKTPGALSDAIFTDAAKGLMESKYQQYLRQTTPQTPEPGGSTAPPAPAATGGKSIYLCFLARDGETVDAWLSALEERGGRAAFYFSEEALSRCGDQLRRLVTMGCSVGLALKSGGEPALEQAGRMNRALFAAAGVKTRLVWGAAEEETARLQAAGYCPLSPRLDYGPQGLTTAGEASALLRRIVSRKGAVSVWMGGNVSSGGLRALLRSAAAGEDRLLAMTESAF